MEDVMKAVLKFVDGREYEVDIDDSFAEGAKSPVNSRFTNWVEYAKREQRLMFGVRNHEGNFVLDADVQAALVAERADLLYAIGVESVGDGRYVPIYDGNVARDKFHDDVRKNIQVDDVQVELGGYFNRSYTINVSSMITDWADAFFESDDYEYAFSQWVEDSVDDFCVVNVMNVTHGVGVRLSFPDSNSDDWDMLS